MNRLARDIDLAHRRRWPSRPVRLVSRSWLFISSPSLHLMLIHRIVYWLHLKRKLGGWRGWLGKAALIPLALPKWAIQINAKSEIPCGAGIDIDIAGGVSIHEHGHIIFGPRKVGAGTMIGARVTVGRGLADGGRPEIDQVKLGATEIGGKAEMIGPVIGEGVWIGAHAQICVDVRIGDGATIGAGAVVTQDIPHRCLAVGNPGRIAQREYDNRAFL